MNLLSSLAMNCDSLQASSLLFCQSPRTTIPTCTAKERLSCAPKANPIIEHDRSSKSLSKMDFMGSACKVNPKQRILHRLAYKLEGKCRKLFYSVFIKLENYIKTQPPIKKVTNPDNITCGVQKFQQIQSVLFSKYFSFELKKGSFRSLKCYVRYQKGWGKMSVLLNRVKKQQAFSGLVIFSKKMEKQSIRMDILITSAMSASSSSQRHQRKNLLRQGWTNILSHSQQRIEEGRQVKETIRTAIIDKVREETPVKKVTNQNAPIETVSCTKSEQINRVYETMKLKAKRDGKSPCKVSQKIKLITPSANITFNRRGNFLTACKVVTGINEEAMMGDFGNDTNTTSKRSEVDKLKTVQVNDLCDKSILFFAPQFQSRPRVNLKTEPYSEMAQSQVQQLNFQGKTISQIGFYPSHRHEFQDNAKMSVVTRNSKGGFFGCQAVNFKNSLISQRQSNSVCQVLTPQRPKRDSSFAKKNMVQNYSTSNPRNSVFVHYQPSECYEEVPKEYFSSRLIIQKDSPSFSRLMAPLPLTVDSSSSNYRMAEPDLQMSLPSDRTTTSEYNRTTTSEYIPVDMSQEGSRPSFIKITKRK